MRQTRAALVAAATELFGSQGFSTTSVEDIARRARLTTGALYHHFPNKTALFEAVFEAMHEAALGRSAEAASSGRDPIDRLLRGCDAFLDAVLRPEVQRILLVDAPAVLGLARFTELDERYAFSAIVELLQEARRAQAAAIDDPETLARLIMGALTRAALLVASSRTPRRTRDRVSATLRQLLTGLVNM